MNNALNRVFGHLENRVLVQLSGKMEGYVVHYTTSAMPKKNKNLPPNVHKRKDGKWEVRVSYNRPEGGRKWMYQVLENKDRVEAQGVVARMRHAVTKLRAGVDLRPVPITMASIIKRYKAAECQPPIYRNGKIVGGRKSADTTLSLLKVLERDFGHRNPRNISYGDIKKWKEERLNAPIVTPMGRKKERSVGGVDRELGTLRSVLTYAIREGWIDKNPFQSGPPLIKKSDSVRRKALLTEDEEERLVNYCLTRKGKSLRHIALAVRMITHGGFRPGELLLIEWKQVDMRERLITLRPEQTKENKERVVPIHDAVIDLLKDTKHKNYLVFGGIKYVRETWNRTRLAINRPDLHLHDLRSVFASRLLNNGVPVHLVQALLGHSSSGVGADVLFGHYARHSLEDLKRAVDTLPSGRWMQAQEVAYR
jgi:integrase